MSLPIVSGRETIKALSKIGFLVIRQKGSHVMLEKRNEKVIKLTVPLHRSLKKGTLRRIINDAGITVNEFITLL
jgi:predicted RNA binding protein YcfA (HicA-like mRNA interferase family)